MAVGTTQPTYECVKRNIQAGDLFQWDSHEVAKDRPQDRLVANHHDKFTLPFHLNNDRLKPLNDVKV
jgi:hypothetical protein